MLRVGMLTSGGDCQALNATMRGVAKTLYNLVDDVQIFGFEEGTSTKERISIISAMLNNGMSQEEVTRMTGIPIKEVKAIKL